MSNISEILQKMPTPGAVPPSLQCSVCREACKRAVKMTCCSIIACRGCAVKNLLKAKKCWSADCGKDATTANMKVK